MNNEMVVSPYLKVEQREEILVVLLNRPEKRNAVNDETLLALEKVFANVPHGIKCAVLGGTGKHFSAGLDLSELVERDTFQGLKHSRMWHRVTERIQFGDVPVIATLHGACVGAGLELASACHIRVAERSTFYALPEGQRGIFVGGGGAVRLTNLIGMARMADMMFTGRVIDSTEGNAIGITQYLAEDGKGLEKALELAAKVASNATITNYALMHILPRITDAAHDQALMMEGLIASISGSTPEARERLKLFLEGKAKKVGQQ